MTDLRKAAEAALEALVHENPLGRAGTINDLRDALNSQSTHSDTCWRWHHECAVAKIERQQSAKPIAWMDREGDLYKMPEIEGWAPPHTMLYAHPPRREWQGLTDGAVSALWSWSMTAEAERIANTQQHAFARAIEAALKEKNGV